ncbi:MAG: peptide antibiotic transporter SbmA [Hyphomicrobiales bacterium]
MLRSFFPTPKLFFLSAVLWTVVAFIVWFAIGDSLMNALNVADLFLDRAPETPEPGVKVAFFNATRVWTYQYIIMFAALFCVFWAFFNRNIWYWWSVVGSAFLMVATYFNVQLSLFINDWYGSFYDLVQRSVTNPNTVPLSDYYLEMSTLAYVLVPFIIFLVMVDYFTSHYLFRWRTALNNFYMENWEHVRHIEGASQRVQEDTRLFSRIMESLGVSFVRSIMTLIAFIPVLWTLSQQITEYPLFGAVDGGLVFLAIFSAILGTVVLAAVGFKLPGLEFENQKVEAAYRKELVYGEDNEDRADRATSASLFGNLKNFYFRYFFHYLYFNVARYAYLQGSVFFPYFALGPAIVTGAITFGVFRQIGNAFNQVENAFQFLVNSWPTIVELMSIHKRLSAFEEHITAEPTNHAMSLMPQGKE